MTLQASSKTETTTLQILNEGEDSCVVDYPSEQTSPLVFASPHSGRAFPRSFFSACIADPMDLRRVEDAYVDLLFEDVTRIGSPFLKAIVSRSCLDLNRSSNELDKSIIDPPLKSIGLSRTPRVQAGLGCIPRIAHAGSPIYGRKLTPEEVQKRLDSVYTPYHRKMKELIDSTRKSFGLSILIDCHSMPAQNEAGKPLADIVIGDRFGASCASTLTGEVEMRLKSKGYSVVRNQPYAGGYITQSQGHPEKRRHALQIEINRSLYMDEHIVELHSGVAKLKTDLIDVFTGINDWATQNIELGNLSLR